MKNKRFFNLVLIIWFAALAFYGYRMLSLYATANSMLEVAENTDMFKPLDMHFFGFNNAEAEKSLRALGDKALPTYRYIEQVEDFWYPISYGILLCLTIILLGWKVHLPRTAVIVAACMPLLAMFFDFYENKFIVQLIDEYPNLLDETVQKASKYNTFKWLFVTIAIVDVLVLLVIKLVKKLKPARLE